MIDLLTDYYLWAILGTVAIGMFACFVWGYVLGVARVEIEEEESHI